MEKYGVETKETEGKTAEDPPSNQCPDCGAALAPPESTNVRRCPNCGTKPFEQR